MMTKAKERMITKMVKLANDLVKNYTWEKNKALWSMCSDWNSNHEESEEIFMCELDADDEHPNGGFCIEDDCWYFQD